MHTHVCKSVLILLCIWCISCIPNQEMVLKYCIVSNILLRQIFEMFMASTSK